MTQWTILTFVRGKYRGADESLARPTSRCILFDGENISFDASLVTYINSTNNPPIMIINRTYETKNLLSLQLFSLLFGIRTYQHPGKRSRSSSTGQLQWLGYLRMRFLEIGMKGMLHHCKFRRKFKGTFGYIMWNLGGRRSTLAVYN